MIGNKECNVCNELFSNTEEYFHKSNTYKDGLQPFCKECARIRSKEHQANLSPEERITQNKHRKQREWNKRYKDHKDFRVVAFDMVGKKWFIIGTTKYTSSIFFGGAIIPYKGQPALKVLGRVRNVTPSQYICQFENTPIFLTSSPKSVKNKMLPTVANKGYTGYGVYSQTEYKKEHRIWAGLLHSNNKFPPTFLNMQYFMDHITNINLYTKWLNQDEDFNSSLVFSYEKLTFIKREDITNVNLSYTAPIITLDNKTDIICECCNKVKPWNDEHFPRVKAHILELQRTCRNCSRQIALEAYNNKVKACYRIKRKKYKKPQTMTPIKKVHKNISSSIRAQLSNINGVKNYTPSAEFIGCTYKELKDHLNKGKYTIEDYSKNSVDEIYFHIDHIIPKDYYTGKLILNEDGTLTKQGRVIMKKCWNYRNLRIWPALDNTLKSNTIDMELIKAHKIEDLL